ncbi:MAG: SIS domain-containing protein [Nocardioidaceae bacterium]
MTYLEQEIATQPQDWLTAAATAREHTALLPRPGERVAVVGCGTSLYVAQAYAALREDAGGGLTDAWPASEHRLHRGYDRVIAITRSGTTTEIVDVLEQLQHGPPTTVITADPDSPVARLAAPLCLPFLAERSVVVTRFATGVLALLRSHLGEDLDRAARQAQAGLDADESSLGPAVRAEQLTFLGRGWTTGLANEAALKLRESVQVWAESYPMLEYRHGPISVARAGRVVWVFGEPAEQLQDDVVATGAHYETAPGIDPMADLLRVHRLCLAKARAAGLDPDRPRHLERSVILGSTSSSPD